MLELDSLSCWIQNPVPDHPKNQIFTTKNIGKWEYLIQYPKTIHIFLR